MKLSVIIPVYNVERYLARCLDSVLKAAVGNEVEIICVNDGSTDGSAAVLARYSDRVKIITKANGGLGSARNAGLDVMTGDYVLFVDSDDWIPECAIAKFAAVAEASKARLVVSTSFLKDEAGNSQSINRLIEKSINSQSTPWRMRPASWIAGKKVQYCAWNKLYGAELFKTRRYPATIYEDFPITTDIFREVGEFAAIDEPLYVYCTNAGAASLVRSAFTERKLRDSLTVVRMTLEAMDGGSCDGFVLNQAADGMSSTIGQVYKSRDATRREELRSGLADLCAKYPQLRKALSVKAKYRLWRMGI